MSGGGDRGLKLPQASSALTTDYIQSAINTRQMHNAIDIRLIAVCLGRIGQGQYHIILAWIVFWPSRFKYGLSVITYGLPHFPMWNANDEAFNEPHSTRPVIKRREKFDWKLTCNFFAGKKFSFFSFICESWKFWRSFEEVGENLVWF